MMKIFTDGHRKNLSLAMIGKKASDETRRKLSESHMGISHVVSEESRKRMSEAQKKRTFGKHSDEQKRKISEGLKRAYAGGRIKKTGWHHTDDAKRRIGECSRQWSRDESMRDKVRRVRIRTLKNSKMTNIEKKVDDFIRGMGKDYEYQFIADWKFIYDFKIGNVLIEVDGKFWHSKPENISNDHRKNEWARNNGFDLIRLPQKIVESGEFENVLMGVEFG